MGGLTHPLTPRLVCLGRFTIDDVFLPDGRHMPHCTGGNALYASLGARLWEPATEMVVAVGEDLPQETWSQVRGAGFRLDGFRRRPMRTMHNQIRYDDQGGRSWVHLFSEQESHTLSPAPEDIPPDYRSAEIFLVQAMTLPAQEALVPWLRENTHGLIALDLKETLIPGNEERLFALLPLVDIFLPSQDEAALLAGSDDWPAVARQFAARGPRLVAIKLNRHGSLAYAAHSQTWFETPAYSLPVVDPTGAGDAYCGGFLATYLDHAGDLQTCLRAGSVSASYAISGYGTQSLAAASRQEARIRLATWQ